MIAHISYKHKHSLGDLALLPVCIEAAVWVYIYIYIYTVYIEATMNIN